MSPKMSTNPGTYDYVTTHSGGFAGFIKLGALRWYGGITWDQWHHQHPYKMGDRGQKSESEDVRMEAEITEDNAILLTWRQRKGLQAKGCGSFGSWNREGGVLPASLQKEPALGPLQMPDLQTQEKKLCGFKLLSGDDLVATANSQDERGSPWMVLRGSGVGDIETPHYQISP